MVTDLKRPAPQSQARDPEAAQAEQPVGAGQALGQALQQHLVQGVQSVLAERLTQAVRQRIEQELEPLRKELQQEVLQAHAPRRQEEQPPPEEPAQLAEEQRAQLASTEGPRGIQGLPPDLFHTWLTVTRGLLEQQGEQRLRSLLDRLFSESVRTSLQQQTEQKLRGMLQTGFEAIVGGSAGHQLQQEMERTLEPLLQDAFDALFAGPARAAVQWHGEQVIQALLHGDFEAPSQHAEQVRQSLLRGVLTLLLHHPKQVEQLLRILLKALLKASQGALGSRFKENLRTIATTLSAEENGPRNVEETGAASRERRVGATETMQQRREKGKDDGQKHVTEGLTSAAKDGAQET